MTLLQEIQAKKPQVMALAEKYGAYDLKVFGSAARGEDDEKSDLDLLVKWRPDYNLYGWVALQDSLSELFGRKVDVVPEVNLHWYLKDRILKEAVPL